jgi:hypothetical protein
MLLLMSEEIYFFLRHHLHLYTYKCVSSIYFLFNRLNSLTRWHGYYLCGIRVHLLILETQNVCFRQYKPSPIQHIWLVTNRKTPKSHISSIFAYKGVWDLLSPIFNISWLLQQETFLDDVRGLEVDLISILINHRLACTALYHYLYI